MVSHATWAAHVSGTHASGAQNVKLDIRWALTDQQVATIDAPRHSTVAALKRMLIKTVKAPPSYMKLFLEGSLFEDSQTLAEAGVAQNAVVKVTREQPSETLLLDLLRSKFKECHAPMAMNAHWILNKPQTESKDDLEIVAYALECKTSCINSTEDYGPWCWRPWNQEEDEKAYQRLTALHYAAIMGLKGVCQLLLDSPEFTQVEATCRMMCTRIPAPYDFEFNLFLQEGCTALHCAVARKQIEVCSLLLQHPRFTSVSALTSRGWTPLHIVAEIPDKKIATLLLEDGRIDVDAPDKSGKTAMEVAWDEAKADHYFLQGASLECTFEEVCLMLRQHSRSNSEAVQRVEQWFQDLDADSRAEDDSTIHGDVRYEATSRKKGVLKFRQQQRKHHSAPKEEHREKCKASTKAKVGQSLLAHALSFSIDD